MKVVVVNDCAHVFEDLMPYLSKKFDITFIRRSRGWFSKTLGIFWKILRAKGDLFHVNYALQDAYIVDKFKRLDVLNVHGSDVRWALHSKKYSWIVKSNLKHANRVLYATPDLEQTVKKFRPDAIYLPTPVKTYVFQHETLFNERPKAVYFKLHYEKMPTELEKILTENGIPLTVMERNVPYDKMPETLQAFDIFVDRFTIPSLSKTCLEAMSCGLATIDYRHKTQLSERVALLSDISNARRIGEKNRKFVVENHEVRKVAEILTKVWEEVL